MTLQEPVSRVRVVRWLALVGLIVSAIAVGSHAAVAEASPPRIDVAANATEVSLAATGMAADFGLDEGIRFVPLRIVTDLVVTVRLRAERDIELDAPPRVCLVGPFWHPNLGGVSDRCWGEPHLSDLVATQLPRDDHGNLFLPGETDIEVTARIARGDARCDSPPGAWVLEVALDPLVDGSPSARRYLDDTLLEVPYDAAESLAYYDTSGTRFCSYASAIFRAQGEPIIELDAPSEASDG